MEENEQSCNIIPVTLDLNNATFIHVNGEASDENIEFQQEVLTLNEGTVTLVDNSQWYKIPVKGKEGEIYVDQVQWGIVEGTDEQSDNISVENVAQVIVKLEDGTLAYIQSHTEGVTEAVSIKPKKKERTHQCTEPGCDRSYTSLHHLKVHMRNHTGDRPYKCSMEGCDKAFATDYSRKAHLRTHTGEKPYPCPFSTCLKSFKTSGDLQKHIRTHTGERPFLCPVANCNKTFTTSNIRKIHIRTHTGERPYTCTFEGCDRSFASSTNFKNHMRIHSGEKPYICLVDNCGKRFTEYSSLYKHHLVHSQAKNYQCSYCLKTYRQLSTLTTHKRTIHNVISAEDGTEIILEQMSVGKDGTRTFKNITSNLLSLKREHSSDDAEEEIYIVPEDELQKLFP